MDPQQTRLTTDSASPATSGHARRQLIGPVAAAMAVTAGTITVALRDPSATAFPPCPFKALTGLDCPGCGALRGTHALFHEGLIPALDHNLLLLPGAILALWLWIVWTADAATGRRMPRLRPTPLIVGSMIATVLAFTVARNIPGVPFLPA